MAATRELPQAQASSKTDGDLLEISLAGVWRITGMRPGWTSMLEERKPARVLVRVDEVERWDSSMLVYLFEVQQRCRATGAYVDVDVLPEKIRALLAQLAASHATSVPFDRSRNFVAIVGEATMDLLGKVRGMLHCGAMALPIVSLISFLTGVTLAYTGALVLRQYGGDIYVADLIGMAVCREMGAVMTAVVLAGRTGAAFAATLGNMKANEEIDALETLGISAVDFLVMPRLLALAIMMPLLALYANALGILGGMAVSMGVLNIPPAAYWVEMGTIVGLCDVAVGVIKALSFGLIVGFSGCLRGLQAERSAAGVGRAATSAVVTSILLIVVADAVFAVIFNVLGW
jgi:phospholipid/cholesterol/gamma-HCH transport system permease protein